MLIAFYNCDMERRKDMHSRNHSKIISIDRRNLRAAQCEECGAKIYPASLLEPHLIRHRVRQRWFNAELRKLQFTFTHMREIA
jgi:uncharacterized OB-fold protein